MLTDIFVKTNNEWKITAAQLTLINQIVSPHTSPGKHCALRQGRVPTKRFYSTSTAGAMSIFERFAEQVLKQMARVDTGVIGTSFPTTTPNRQADTYGICRKVCQLPSWIRIVARFKKNNMGNQYLSALLNEAGDLKIVKTPKIEANRSARQNLRCYRIFNLRILFCVILYARWCQNLILKSLHKVC